MMRNWLPIQISSLLLAFSRKSYFLMDAGVVKYRFLTTVTHCPSICLPNLKMASCSLGFLRGRNMSTSFVFKNSAYLTLVQWHCSLQISYENGTV